MEMEDLTLAGLSVPVEDGRVFPHMTSIEEGMFLAPRPPSVCVHEVGSITLPNGGSCKSYSGAMRGLLGCFSGDMRSLAWSPLYWHSETEEWDTFCARSSSLGKRNEETGSEDYESPFVISNESGLSENEEWIPPKSKPTSEVTKSPSVSGRQQDCPITGTWGWRRPSERRWRLSCGYWKWTRRTRGAGEKVKQRRSFERR